MTIDKNFWRMDFDEDEAKRKMEALGINPEFLDPPKRKTFAELQAEFDAAVREMEEDEELLWLVYRAAGCEPPTKGNA